MLKSVQPYCLYQSPCVAINWIELNQPTTFCFTSRFNDKTPQENEWPGLIFKQSNFAFKINPVIHFNALCRREICPMQLEIKYCLMWFCYWNKYKNKALLQRGLTMFSQYIWSDLYKTKAECKSRVKHWHCLARQDRLLSGKQYGYSLVLTW